MRRAKCQQPQCGSSGRRQLQAVLQSGAARRARRGSGGSVSKGGWAFGPRVSLADVHRTTRYPEWVRFANVD
eukprot:4297544-Lingulodinium_polyedra.AAC.1